MVTLIVSFMSARYVQCPDTRHLQLFGLRFSSVLVMATFGSSRCMSGFSMSAPHVAGVVALARGHCPNIVSRAFTTAAVLVATATLAALAVYAAQAPLVEHIAPAPAVSYAAPTPVVECATPALAVCAALALVLDNPAPAGCAANTPVVESWCMSGQQCTLHPHLLWATSRQLQQCTPHPHLSWTTSRQRQLRRTSSRGGVRQSRASGELRGSSAYCMCHISTSGGVHSFGASGELHCACSCSVCRTFGEHTFPAPAVSYYSVENQFERFRGVLELISRFEFEFRHRENYSF